MAKDKNKKSKISKIIKVINYIILVLLIVLVAFLIYSKVTNKLPTFFGNSMVKILSGSMEPEISTGSYILIKEIEPSEVKPNDIITFYSSDPSLSGMPNTHRVVEVKEQNGEYSFVTKGDNNAIKDIYEAKGENLIGRYNKSLPLITRFGSIIGNKNIFLLIVLIPAAILLILEILNVIKQSKKLSQQKLIEEEVEKLKLQNKTDLKGGDDNEG